METTKIDNPPVTGQTLTRLMGALLAVEVEPEVERSLSTISIGKDSFTFDLHTLVHPQAGEAIDDTITVEGVHTGVNGTTQRKLLTFSADGAGPITSDQLSAIPTPLTPVQ